MTRIIILIFSLVTIVSGQSPYCRFHPDHTMCLYRGFGHNCGPEVQSFPVTAQEAAFIVDYHNRLRSRVATGREREGNPGPQPQAANMVAMVWDNELSLLAQGHADQCVFEHECSPCRKVSRFGVGQNLFISAEMRRDTTAEWALAIDAWYNEVDLFNPSHIQPYQYSPAIGHYTQMLWSDTYTIGCGLTMFKQGIWWRKLYTCDYGPGGNIIFFQMYSRGRPCSACPSGTTCSLLYPGLCDLIVESAPVNPRITRQRQQSATLTEPHETLVEEGHTPKEEEHTHKEDEHTHQEASSNNRNEALASKVSANDCLYNEKLFLALINIHNNFFYGYNPNIFR